MDSGVEKIIVELLKEVREETTNTGKKVASIETKIDDYNDIKQKFTEACEEIRVNKQNIINNQNNIEEFLKEKKWLKRAVIVAILSAIASVIAAIASLLISGMFSL